MQAEETFFAVVPNAPFFLWGNNLSQYILQNEANLLILSRIGDIYEGFIAYKQVRGHAMTTVQHQTNIE